MRPIDKRKVSKNREKFSIVSKFLDRGPKKNILYREQGEKRPQTLKKRFENYFLELLRYPQANFFIFCPRYLLLPNGRNRNNEFTGRPLQNRKNSQKPGAVGE